LYGWIDIDADIFRVTLRKFAITKPYPIDEK